MARALELLREAARSQLTAARPGDGRRLGRIRLQFELDLDHGVDERHVRSIEEQLQRAAAAYAAEHRTADPTRIPCRRCESDCSCGEPGPRQIFGGWTPSGQIRWVDFAQYLIDRSHPEVDQLYRSSAPPVFLVERSEDLEADLLDAFREKGQPDFVLHGQVVGGWFRHPAASPDQDTRCAVSWVFVSHRAAERRWRARMLVVGTTGEGEDVEVPFEGSTPWRQADQWARRALRDLERRVGRSHAGASEQWMSEESVHDEMLQVIDGFASRLERRDRASRRRTRHAEQRRRQARPTGMALRDLEEVPDRRVLRDVERSTWVVLGDRGRVHVFNDAAKLVTSVRYSQSSIDRRVERGFWKTAPPSEVHRLRQMVAGAEG